MAANFQQFGTRLSSPLRHAGEVCSSSLEQQLANLTSLVRQRVENMQREKYYGNHSAMRYPSNGYPTFYEESFEQVNMVSGFPEPRQVRYDSYSNMYNPGWKDHLNFRYGNAQNSPAEQNFTNFHHNQQAYYPRQDTSQDFQVSTPLEDIVKSLTQNTHQFQQEVRASIQSLTNQIGQLATTVSRLEAQNSEIESLAPASLMQKEENSALNEKDDLEVDTSKPTKKEAMESTLSAKFEENNSAGEEAPEVQQTGKDLSMLLPISNKMPVPSILQYSDLGLKSLPSHLKGIYSGEPPPVITSNKYALLKDRGKLPPALAKTQKDEIKLDAKSYSRHRLFPGKLSSHLIKSLTNADFPLHNADEPQNFAHSKASQFKVDIKDPP